MGDNKHSEIYTFLGIILILVVSNVLDIGEDTVNQIVSRTFQVIRWVWVPILSNLLISACWAGLAYYVVTREHINRWFLIAVLFVGLLVTLYPLENILTVYWETGGLVKPLSRYWYHYGGTG